MEALSPAGALPPLTAIMEIEFGVKIVFGVIIPAELELKLHLGVIFLRKWELTSLRLMDGRFADGILMLASLKKSFVKLGRIDVTDKEKQ